MNRKKRFQWMVAMVMGLTMTCVTMTSCSSDDDDPAGGSVPNVGQGAVSVKEFGQLTKSDLGWVIGADSKAYANVAAAAASNTEALAVITIVNDDAGQYVYAEALQLNCAQDLTWNEANEYVHGLPKIKNAAWTLLSVKQLKQMLSACAIEGDLTTTTEVKMSPISGFKSKYDATGSTWQNGWYWTSDVASSDQAYIVAADITGTFLPYALFGNPAPKNYPYSARGVLSITAKK